MQISAELTNDKFLQTLKSTLTVLSQLLELATLNEVSRCADELLSYLASTFALEPSVSLICVRQVRVFGSHVDNCQYHDDDVIMGCYNSHNGMHYQDVCTLTIAFCICYVLEAKLDIYVTAFEVNFWNKHGIRGRRQLD